MIPQVMIAAARTMQRMISGSRFFIVGVLCLLVNSKSLDAVERRGSVTLFSLIYKVIWYNKS